jgi:membrane fusion protein (multidrug efflux system)
MPRLRLAAAQLDLVVGDLDGNVDRMLDAYERADAAGCDLVAFPELSLTGYPPEDLLLRPSFVAHCGDALEKFAARTGRTAAVVGFPEAQRDLAKANFSRMKQLLDAGVISRSDFDAAVAQQKQTEANVAETKATIERKTICAPFSGVLGIRKINLGQYLAAGNAIVPLQSLDPIYVDFGVPQQDATQVRPGSTLHVSSEDIAGRQFSGRVTALDSVVDEATRNVTVQATLANPGGKLKPGMFVQVQLGFGQSRSVITLPASAISYAPYGDSVFVVTDLKDPSGKTYRGVRQQFVKVGTGRGDQIGIVSGLKVGDEVVSSGVFKLRNGAAVLVNNKITPANSPKPQPENS